MKKKRFIKKEIYFHKVHIQNCGCLKLPEKPTQASWPYFPDQTRAGIEISRAL